MEEREPGSITVGQNHVIRDLEIVIVSFNCADFLRACLSSLPAACGEVNWRCWVVDNASTDQSPEAALEALPDLQLIRNTSNVGFARANNQALSRADARYLLLLNPDTEPEPNSFSTLIQFMDATPQAGAGGPMLLNSDGSIQQNGRRFPTLIRELLTVTGLRRIRPRLYETALEYGRNDFQSPAEVDYLMGACLLVRSEAARQVGYLDESYFMFYEEVEWCRRLKNAGWSIWYRPEARVVHHWMGSVRLAPKRMTRAFYRSQVTYFRQTGGPVAGAASTIIAALGLLKNEAQHLGAAAKRALRSAGLLGKRPESDATST
jgi:N-acetylglucosaminyl-diphospho-decaprenol L-rhamnosyltransferase